MATTLEPLSARQACILNTLARLEETGLSIFLRESGLAFFTSLTLHSLAMAFVVGINIAISLRLLGVGEQQALPAFRKFLPLHWMACGLILASGIALLLAYPAKALTNPVFYLKLAALSMGLLITAWLHRGWLQDRELTRPRLLATAALLCWCLTIGAGRFLAYTHSVLLASRYF